MTTLMARITNMTIPAIHPMLSPKQPNTLSKVEKTEHVHPVEAAKTVRQEGVIAAKKG